MNAYRIILKLLPAEPRSVFDYTVVATGSESALKKVFKRMQRDTKGCYTKTQTMEVQSLERLDSTVVL